MENKLFHLILFIAALEYQEWYLYLNQSTLDNEKPEREAFLFESVPNKK
jgi:hypothetical protein